MTDTAGANVAVMTFLFSDVEGSTRLLERFPKAQPLALNRHDEILTSTILKRHGTILETVGDGFYIAFDRASDAVAAAVDAQLDLRAQDWGEVGEIRVRMALHTGEAERRGENFAGPPLYRCARLLALAHGGQVLLSRATSSLVRNALPPEAGLRSMGEHRLRDLIEPEEVFQLLHPRLPDTFPALRSVDARPNNLPAELTAFVGREHERAEAARLLESSRLVTITGPGGVGKTRLALAVASAQLSAFQHGVFLIDLSGVSDPARVASAVGHALHVAEPADGSWLDVLRAELRDKQVLLLFDNFEQIVAAGRLVTDLLTACPKLKAMVTSRQCLQVSGEHELSLSPLAVPALNATAALEDAEANEAIGLFVRRAQAIRPSFALTAENAGAVAEICRRLDGLPLAIELAAARVKMLQPRELLARLKSDSDARTLSVLTGGRQDVSARHQTLRAAIDWSYQLLTTVEQRLFCQLGVFVGGWTLDAVEAVCGDEDADVVDTLASLLDKSLVRSAEGTEDETRYAMLGTIGQFALEQLQAGGDERTVAERHAHHYAAFAEQAEPGLTGPEQGATLRRLELDYPNLQAALRRVTEHEDHETALRLAGALWRFWLGSGRVAEGLDAVQRALRGSANSDASPDRIDIRGDRAGPAPQRSPLLLRAKALTAGGNLAFQRGNLDLAAELHEECLALRRSAGDTRGIAGALNNLGLIAWQRGDVTRAQQLYEESLVAYQEVDNPHGMALVMSNLGILAAQRNDDEDAQTFYEESLQLRRELADRQGEAISLQNLADLAVKRGELSHARHLLQESLTLYRALGNQRGLAYTFDGLGSLALAADEPERAARLFGSAEAIREATGAALLPAERDQHEREAAAATAALGAARYTEALNAGRAMAHDDAVDYALGEHTGEHLAAFTFEIQIDREKAEQQVAEIAETDFFQELQARVKARSALTANPSPAASPSSANPSPATSPFSEGNTP